MIREVLEWINGLKDERPITVQIGKDVFAVKGDRTLGEAVREVAPLVPPTFNVATLTGFVDAYHADIDEFAEKSVVLLESYASVCLTASVGDGYGRRHVWIRAKADEVNPFRFGNYYEPEDFIITAQAAFAPNDNLSALLTLCSNLTAGSSVQVSDDGFSQTVVLNDGGVKRSGAEIPPRIGLAPYRTFREIDPVASDFLVRMRARKDALPEIALFEVDGGAWKGTTALAVKEWLQAQIPEAKVIA